ncbi:hypothetical protein PHMEG_00031484 [Phytophthora megakarya]|uniref:Uncharacterized protein n=1 Tax=Phytophthora megakarya TaxID=4795 RepID=A0A225V0D3_9STRA|nr:hypothetical protein PHMEG_00031484 [Phytophthora megakarya]
MERRGGGSRTTVPRRNRKKGPTRQEAAYARAVEKLGEDTLKEMGDDWGSWDTKYGSAEWEQSEGVVLNLLQQGFSEREIKAILPVGGSRVSRLPKVLALGVDTLHTRRQPSTPWHAFTDKGLDNFKAHCSTWVLEDGFPCAHHRPRQYFTEPNLTWLVVHSRYVYDSKREDSDARTMSYSRFTQYVHFYYPGQPELTAYDKQIILLEKTTHLNEAISQRRFVSSFIRS